MEDRKIKFEDKFEDKGSHLAHFGAITYKIRMQFDTERDGGRIREIGISHEYILPEEHLRIRANSVHAIFINQVPLNEILGSLDVC